MNEEFLLSAGVVELTRLKMKQVLTDPKLKTANFTDSGLEFMYDRKVAKKEKIGLNEENVFELGAESYFCKVGENVILQRNMSNVNSRIIDKSGRVQEKSNFFGKYYYLEEVKEKDGIRYCVTSKINGLGNKEVTSVLDTGRPVFSDDNNSSFETNYNVYSELFPSYKEWLDDRFLKGRKLDDVVKKVDTIYYTDRLHKLGTKRLSTIACIENEKREYEENRRKLNNLIKFLKEYDCETEAGKEKIDEFIKLAEDTKVEDIDIDFDCLKKQRESLKDKYSDLELEELKKETKNAEDDVQILEDILSKYINANGKLREVVGMIKRKILETTYKNERNIALKRDVEEEEVEY